MLPFFSKMVKYQKLPAFPWPDRIIRKEFPKHNLFKLGLPVERTIYIKDHQVQFFRKDIFQWDVYLGNKNIKNFNIKAHLWIFTFGFREAPIIFSFNCPIFQPKAYIYTTGHGLYMSKQAHYFNDVTLLVTHYNRSKSLERLLKSFEDLNCKFEEIVISDDGSKQEHLDYINGLQSIYDFRLVTTPKNKGLGNNINKGQKSIKTEYTLYIQEDFIAKDVFPEHFIDGLNIMKAEKKWDMVSFYAYEYYPYSKPYKLGFAEKLFTYAPWCTNNIKFYLYSDHPHLRRSSFLEKFGAYVEGINADQTEMQMSFSFIKNKGKALFYEDHYGLLTQDNPETEGSTATFRKEWKNKENPLFRPARWLYAKLKFIKLNARLLATPKQNANT